MVILKTLLLSLAIGFLIASLVSAFYYKEIAFAIFDYVGACITFRIYKSIPL